MKVAVSWHGRINKGDALNCASLLTDTEEEVGDNTQQRRKQGFEDEWESFCRMLWE